VIEILAQRGDWPTTGYAASNPPLYYYLSAMILRLTGSLKMVQLMSLFAYLPCVFLFYKIAGLCTGKWSVRYAFTAFFALLPVTLNYAFIVFNYSLGHAFSLLAVFTLLYMVTARRATFLLVCALGVIAGLGLLTSLTNLAMIPVTVGSVLVLPRFNLQKKAALLTVFLAITGVTVLPYYKYKVETYGSFLSAPNKGAKTNRGLTEIFPLRYFYNINMDMFEKPYVHNYLGDSLWIRLHQTMYSDYFNYLVGERLSSSNAGENEARVARGEMFTTNPHYIDAERITKFRVLNYLGIPISLLVAICFVARSYRAVQELRAHDRRYLTGFVLMLTAVAFFMQFLAYIFRYPYFQCVHAGYIMPACFALLLITIECVAKKKWALFVSAYLLVFALYSAYTFLI
jgi:hypothetical protein